MTDWSNLSLADRGLSTKYQEAATSAAMMAMAVWASPRCCVHSRTGLRPKKNRTNNRTIKNAMAQPKKSDIVICVPPPPAQTDANVFELSSGSGGARRPDDHRAVP